MSNSCKHLTAVFFIFAKSVMPHSSVGFFHYLLHPLTILGVHNEVRFTHNTLCPVEKSNNQAKV